MTSRHSLRPENDERRLPVTDEAAGGTGMRDLRERIAGMLARAGILDPEVDADLLIGHVLGASRGRVQALAVLDAPVGSDRVAAVLEMAGRRAQREPLQHVTGVAAFRGLELRVGPGVFIPRPETEIVAQLAIDALAAAAAPSPIGVDLGTGSGAIALAMAREVPHARVFGVERSAQAYRWACRNRQECGAENATLVAGDFADALHELDGTVDVVVSNPPYVPAGAVPVDPEVALFDPAEALYGGEDGLDAIRVLSPTARRLLHPGGTLILEHAEQQGGAIRALLAADGWRAAATGADLTGRDRYTSALR